MKSELLATYVPPEGYYINRVICFDKYNSVVVLNNPHGMYRLDKLNDGAVIASRDIELKIRTDIEKLRRKCFFKVGEYLACFQSDYSMQLIDNHTLQVIQVVPPHNHLPKKEKGADLNPFLACFNDQTNEVVVGLEDYKKIGYPPRYLVELTFKSDCYQWGTISQLPLSKYPKTYMRTAKHFAHFATDEWLNIESLTAKSDSIFTFSTGGGITRLKSGQRYEFGIISKFDKNLDWVENYILEEGIGSFTSDKLFFILRPRSKTGKLYFYNSSDFTLSFDLSITPKQNLGKQKKRDLRFDSYDDRFFLYHNNFLNICKFLNANELAT